MEDAITDIPPPSRFFQDDLNNFTPPSPPLPSPFLLFQKPNSKRTLRPSLLIIAISSPSLYLFHHVPSKTLIGTLILPEIPFSGNTIEPSLKDRSCNIYSLGNTENSVIIVSVQYTVTAERSYSVGKLLIGEQINPERVLILDSVNSQNFRGNLSRDETFAFKLETLMERRNDPPLKGLDYFPSGSVMDGLGAALLARCEMRKIKGTLCVSWPQVGHSVVSLVKSILLKCVLPGLEFDMKGDEDDAHPKFGMKDRYLDFELYT